MKEKNKNGKEILRLLQENYELNTAQDLSSALKNMFKDTCQDSFDTYIFTGDENDKNFG